VPSGGYGLHDPHQQQTLVTSGACIRKSAPSGAHWHLPKLNAGVRGSGVTAWPLIPTQNGNRHTLGGNMWTKNPHSPSGKWRRQNLNRVNIFKPTKPSVFFTTAERPWCVWLPNCGLYERGDDNRMAVAVTACCYRFGSFDAASNFVQMVFQLKLTMVYQIERHLNFYGGERA
jgi:hypothetical protein